MSYVSITGVTIGIALLAVVAIGLLSYLSQLVKSAYQIKVEIRSDMESGMKKLEDELNKKTKWMRSEVGEDVAKIKQGLEQDSGHRLDAIEQRLTELVHDLDQASRAERADLRVVANQLRKRVNHLDQEVTALKEEAARRIALGQKRRDDQAHTQARDAQSSDSSADRTPPSSGLQALTSQRATTEETSPQSAASQSADAGDDRTPNALNTASAPSAAESRASHLRSVNGVQRMELREFDGGSK